MHCFKYHNSALHQLIFVFYHRTTINLHILPPGSCDWKSWISVLKCPTRACTRIPLEPAARSAPMYLTSTITLGIQHHQQTRERPGTGRYLDVLDWQHTCGDVGHDPTNNLIIREMLITSVPWATDGLVIRAYSHHCILSANLYCWTSSLVKDKSQINLQFYKKKSQYRLYFLFFYCFILTNIQLNYAATHPLFNYMFQKLSFLHWQG